MAYTLQVDREAMEERLGLIVRSIDELVEKLKRFLEDDVKDLYRGRVKRNKETLAVFTADEDLQKAMNAWISKDKYSKLLDLWVKGLVVYWNKIYAGPIPRRISLPTYPFARERYWLPEASINHVSRQIPHAGEGGSEAKMDQQAAVKNRLHPLARENTADFESR